jgi:hypothetical protein
MDVLAMTKSAIFPRRFCIMVALAQGLPVRLIPKQLAIAFVRDDMINHRSQNNFPSPLANHTQRMRQQKRHPRAPPCAVISTCCRTTPPPIMLTPPLLMLLFILQGMLFTIPRLSHQSSTTAMAAGHLRALRHR